MPYLFLAVTRVRTEKSEREFVFLKRVCECNLCDKDLQVRFFLLQSFMGKKEQTTVNLTEKAQTIKDDLAPVFGLKNILSAGLILFSRLSAEQKMQVIKDANGNELE